MVKNILRMAMTFVVLTVAYTGYSRGFAILAPRVATLRSTPILPPSITDSQGKQEATNLAITAFGPGHWAVTAPMRWYDKKRGYYFYWRDHTRLDDGKTWEFSPVAIITRSKNSRELKTISGDKARLDFNRPFDMSSPGDDPAHVTHAVIRDNVRIRADKGTPDIADDFVTDPLTMLEFDEAKEQIVSTSDERVVFRQADLTVTGTGLVMRLRPKDPADRLLPKPAMSSGVGFDGVKSITLLRDVEIDVQDVGNSGIVPGGGAKPAKVVVTTTKDGKTTTKAESRPGHIQCARAMTIDLPSPRRLPRVGPPAPADPTFATFDSNVRVRQGDRLHPEQLDCDHLLATLYPSEKPAAAKAQPANGSAPMLAATKDAPKGATNKGEAKADSEEPAQGGSLSNLTLHRAHATGHAVWLQSEAQGMKGLGNELIYNRYLPEKPDQIFFRGDRSTNIVKTDFDAAGKPQTINTIDTKHVTVFQNAPGGLPPTVDATGPGTLEARAAGQDVVDRFASWQDRLVMQSVPGAENRVITLYGHPRVSSTTQGDITADEWIVAEMEPKAPKAGATTLKVVEADGKAVPAKPEAETTARTEETAKTGEAMRIKRFRALGNVLFVSVAAPADPKANPPRAASARKEITARRIMKADFADAPAVPPAAKKPETAAATIPIIERPELTAQAEPPKPVPAPEAKPAEPGMTAIADDVWALILQQPGSNKGQVQEARLTGDVAIHQDPAAGKTQGTDISGKVVFLKNGGENRTYVQAQGTTAEPAVAITEERTIVGPILALDQANDHAWVKGAGRLELEQKDTDFLDDTAPAMAQVRKEKDAEKPVEPKSPKVKKGPLIITWGKTPDDPTALMHFWGRPADKAGRPGPALARFYSHVRAHTDDSSVACEFLDATFDGPIAFVKAKTDPKAAKSKEKEPGPQIALLHCVKDVEIIARKLDPETGYLKDKKRILHQDVTYEKATGLFTTAKGPGEVFLYTTSTKDEDKKGPLATSPPRRAVKPVTSRVSTAGTAKTKADPPQISLTHIRFQKQMRGRFAPPKDAKPNEYSEAEFFGDVESIMAKVADESVALNADHPPDDFYRLVSRQMKVIIEPPPTAAKTKATEKKEPDRVLLDAWGNAHLQTGQKSMRGDRVTYDSMNELSYIYGYEGKVDVANQDGAAQPSSNVRSDAVVHNHKTGFTQLINPQTFQIIDPRSGTRSPGAVPLTPSELNRKVPGLAAPSNTKIKDPNDPMYRARQLKLPPRSNPERRGFYGR